ncbi:MAG: NIPSNAP family protein [Chloroflexi bacterium]|nr:NIPSNAP family protein [Chloroflexota bacterium]MCI0785395.1 NIPSNAP family protein [Chloroflexota bacterium]MCI0793521.1 NIPSNAP family protein [Chloroflexota bacterium]MCI0799118.1 NIPSNAP family protein [Chloroflexota bacterium]MCI0860236.1 NIPSNAP family protein [Chloroflexota bacterium]
MIYEVRTYDLKPGTVAQFEENFGKALPAREKYSKLAAFWHTDIGPLNQVIHVWGYESLEEREHVRAEASKADGWPPPSDGVILNMNSEIWTPAPFMRPMGGDQALGGIYEMRIYTYEPGSIPELIRKWSEALPYREEFSPLAAGMYTELGGLNRWMHVWPYKDLADRARVREEASKSPHWPSGAPGRVRQENKILIPASFSPMH